MAKKIRYLSLAPMASAIALSASCHSFSFPMVPPNRRSRGLTAAARNTGDAEAVDKVQIAIDKYISTLQSSLDDGSFESFTLKGPSAPRKRRRKKTDANDAEVDALLEEQKEKLRGKYKAISGRMVLLQDKKPRKRKKNASRGENDNGDDGANGSLYVQATIKYHLATDLAKNWRIQQYAAGGGQTEVEEGLRQIFATATGNGITDERGDAPLSEWGAQNMNEDAGILAGDIETAGGVYKLQLQPRHKASFKLSKRKKQGNGGSASQKSSDLSHDRSKNVPLPPSSEFFQKLGVSNADGKPVNGMASKLRQCQKFVEVVGNLVNDAASGSDFPTKIRVIDMGCGRGYLTFSLHSYLSSKFGSTGHVKRGVKCSVETQGIDRRPKLIDDINSIASDLGGDFDTLNFTTGQIGETPMSLFGSSDTEETGTTLDILIALHACDCATDDAIWFGLERNADIIVTAPCCQHELRPQIDSHASKNANHPLRDILRHAIYRERAAETVTDAMRAILLEIAGYNTQVFEFIGGEHTAKNVMITATKMKSSRKENEHERWLQSKRGRLVDLAQLYGIKRQRLASLMGENIASSDGGAKSKTAAKNLSGMAPLE